MAAQGFSTETEEKTRGRQRTMASLKLSPTMEEALRYAVRGYQGIVAYAGKRTEDALETRGLITWEHNVLDADGVQRLYPVITAAGWDFLREAYGIERPADEGRMTLEEAWDDAQAEAEADEWIAAIDRSLNPDEGRMTLEEAFADLRQVTTCVGLPNPGAGRMTLEEAFADAYTPLGQVTCKHGRGLADTCDHCPGDSVLIDTTGVDVTGLAAVLSEANRITSEHDAARIREAESFQRSGRGHVAGQAYDREVVPREDATTLTFGLFKGVPIPVDVMEDWRGTKGSTWRRGVVSAQTAARETVSRALPPIGAPAFECSVCRWKFTSASVRDSHREGHRK